MVPSAGESDGATHIRGLTARRTVSLRPPSHSVPRPRRPRSDCAAPRRRGCPLPWPVGKGPTPVPRRHLPNHVDPTRPVRVRTSTLRSGVSSGRDYRPAPIRSRRFARRLSRSPDRGMGGDAMAGQLPGAVPDAADRPPLVSVGLPSWRKRRPVGACDELQGYASDEPLSDLVGRLVLPGPFEERRVELEVELPNVHVPQPESGALDD